MGHKHGTDRPSLTAELMERFYVAHSRNTRIFHIVIDDGNTHWTDAAFCNTQAIESGDPEFIELGRLLSRMSSTQLRKLHKFDVERECRRKLRSLSKQCRFSWRE
jgi:hypothetical protein